MVGRTSKKDKKITLPDVKKPNNINIITGGTFKKINDRWRQRFMTKAITNSHLGELFKPIVFEKPGKIDIDVREEITQSVMSNVRDFNEHYPRCNNPCPGRFVGVYGKCAICGNSLHKDFPDDYPDDWKFCCACKMLGDLICDGMEARSQLAKKVYDKITLKG